MSDSAASRRFTGRTALTLFLSFFGIVFAVNGVFVYVATESWRGIDTEDAYRRGLAYNETLARAEAQRALGWRTELSLEGARLVLRLADRVGEPLNGLEVTGVARRPVDAAADRPLVFEWVGDGVYRAGSELPAHGQWDARISVTRRDGPPYLIEQRLWLK